MVFHKENTFLEGKNKSKGKSEFVLKSTQWSVIISNKHYKIVCHFTEYAWGLQRLEAGLKHVTTLENIKQNLQLDVKG